MLAVLVLKEGQNVLLLVKLLPKLSGFHIMQMLSFVQLSDGKQLLLCQSHYYKFLSHIVTDR